MPPRDAPSAASAGGGCRPITTAVTAAPPSEMLSTVAGPMRSDSQPPSGRAMTAAIAKPAVVAVGRVAVAPARLR